MIDSKYIKKIEDIFKPEYYSIYRMYDFIDSYLFAIKRNDAKDSVIMDPYYTINKQSLEIKGFLPHLQWEKFELAIKCPVKWR